MGARPSSFKKPGGFLNGIDGKITGYRWTDEFGGEPFKPGKNAEGQPKFHGLQFELAARVDGADEDITQNLRVGAYDDYEVSEDGLTLISADGGACGIRANSQVGLFINTLVTPTEGGKGFPEDRLSDDPNSVNFEPIIGTRVRFGQREELGKDGKVKQRIAKKGKFAGKSFPVTSTIIEAVYELPVESAKGTKTKGKAAGKSVDASELATDTLIAILEGAGGSIPKTKLKMAVLRKLTGNPQHEAVSKLVTSDAYLNDSDLWEYDGTTVTLAA